MQDCKTRISTYTLCKRSSRLWQAGFRTFAEREARHGLPQKVDPDSLLPEDVYEDLVPVLRNDVRDQWKHRIQAGIGSKRIFIWRIKMNKYERWIKVHIKSEGISGWSWDQLGFIPWKATSFQPENLNSEWSDFCGFLQISRPVKSIMLENSFDGFCLGVTLFFGSMAGGFYERTNPSFARMETWMRHWRVSLSMAFRSWRSDRSPNAPGWGVKFCGDLTIKNEWVMLSNNQKKCVNGS